MTAELDDQEIEDSEDSEDTENTSDNSEGTETISDASLDDLAGDDVDGDADPDVLVDDKQTDNELADVRRRIERLEEEKRFQSDLDYLDEDFDD